MRGQTLMSTDIIKFQNPEPEASQAVAQRVVQPKAVEFYLMVSLPLVIGVFVAWYGVYLWETRKENRNKERTASAHEDVSEKV